MEVVTSSLQDMSIISHLMTCGQVEFVVMETETLKYIQNISSPVELQTSIGRIICTIYCNVNFAQMHVFQYQVTHY